MLGLPEETEDTINETIANSFTIRTSVNRATGNDATVFYNKDGSYVIRDNVTGDVIQISHRNKPWVPDREIIDPYFP